MKGMKSIAGALLSVFVMMACSDDKSGYTPEEPTIAIVSQDLSFGPQGRTGTLVFQADGAVTASLTSDWCSAQVSGNTVTVNVEDNQSIEGRVAILTLTSAGRSVKFPVQQRGMIATSFPENDCHAENAGSVMSYTISHDFPVELVTAADWIHPVMEGETLNVTIDPNTTGQIRRGTVTMTCGGQEDALSIVQYDFGSNVAGSYYLKGTSNDGSPYELGFELYEKDGVIYTDWTSHDKWTDAVFPVAFDAEKCVLTIPSAMTFYTTSSGNYDIGYFHDADGTLAVTSAVGMSATLFCEPTLQSTYGLLEDNGSWPGHTCCGFALKSSTKNGRLIKTTKVSDIFLQHVGPLGSL